MRLLTQLYGSEDEIARLRISPANVSPNLAIAILILFCSFYSDVAGFGLASYPPFKFGSSCRDSAALRI